MKWNSFYKFAKFNKFNKRFTYLTFRCYFLKILGWSELIEKNSILIFHQDNINDSPKFKKKLLLV